MSKGGGSASRLGCLVFDGSGFDLEVAGMGGGGRGAAADGGIPGRGEFVRSEMVIEQARPSTNAPGKKASQNNTENTCNGRWKDFIVLACATAGSIACRTSITRTNRSPPDAFEYWIKPLRPCGDVKVISPYMQTGSCLLPLKRRSGPPFLFTYAHV